MASSGMLRLVAFIGTDVSEELRVSFIRVTRISELGTTLAVTSVCRLLVMANIPSSPILVTLMREELSSSETSVLTRATWRNIPEDAILHSTTDIAIRRQHSGSHQALTRRLLYFFHPSSNTPQLLETLYSFNQQVITDCHILLDDAHLIPESW
jgi:hypothetical protein